MRAYQVYSFLPVSIKHYVVYSLQWWRMTALSSYWFDCLHFEETGTVFWINWTMCCWYFHWWLRLSNHFCWYTRSYCSFIVDFSKLLLSRYRCIITFLTLNNTAKLIKSELTWKHVKTTLVDDLAQLKTETIKSLIQHDSIHTHDWPWGISNIKLTCAGMSLMSFNNKLDP